VLDRIRDEADLIERRKYELQMQENLKLAEECPFQPRLDSYINDEVREADQRSSRTAKPSTNSKTASSTAKTTSTNATRRTAKNSSSKNSS